MGKQPEIQGWTSPPRLLSPRLAYDKVAAGYRRWRWYRFWRINETPIVADWLRSLRTGRGLDLGSGTGPYLRLIGDLGHRCVALDLSLQMLRQIPRGLGTAKAGPRPRRVQGDIVALPFADDSFDWILCTRVLSHVPDHAAAMREMARVLTADGECLLTDVHPAHPYDYVSIPHQGTRVAIETYKHSLTELNDVSATAGLRVESVKEYALGDLTEKPPRVTFAKLYAEPARQIFYVCRLVKAACPRVGSADQISSAVASRS